MRFCAVAKAKVSQCKCADSPEPSLLAQNGIQSPFVTKAQTRPSKCADSPNVHTWGTGEQTKLFQGNKRTREQVSPYQGSVGPNRQILGVIRAESDGSGESAHLSLA